MKFNDFYGFIRNGIFQQSEIGSKPVVKHKDVTGIEKDMPFEQPGMTICRHNSLR